VNASKVSALFIASRDGLHEMVQLLIEGGANMDCQCEGAGLQTPLIISTANENHKVVKLLLKVISNNQCYSVISHSRHGAVGCTSDCQS